AGIAIGAVIAFSLTPLLAWQLFHVTPTDPLTYLSVALTLGLTAIFAALVPARRAMRIGPPKTLRNLSLGGSRGRIRRDRHLSLRSDPARTRDVARSDPRRRLR